MSQPLDNDENDLQQDLRSYCNMLQNSQGTASQTLNVDDPVRSFLCEAKELSIAFDQFDDIERVSSEDENFHTFKRQKLVCEVMQIEALANFIPDVKRELAEIRADFVREINRVIAYLEKHFSEAMLLCDDGTKISLSDVMELLTEHISKGRFLVNPIVDKTSRSTCILIMEFLRRTLKVSKSSSLQYCPMLFREMALVFQLRARNTMRLFTKVISAENWESHPIFGFGSLTEVVFNFLFFC